MFLAVPVAAVIKVLITDLVDYKYKKREELNKLTNQSE